MGNSQLHRANGLQGATVRLIDGETFVAPDADVAINIPRRWGGRYSIEVRGQVMARGWCFRDFRPVIDAVADVALQLIEVPGYGVEAASLRRLAGRAEQMGLT